ncbi:MAG TPA: PAS domain S-box protein, partial [Burkholderiaceae bacterium]|nr:PAS domain S-box protein [Burkholderiaceae bacterium]
GMGQSRVDFAAPDGDPRADARFRLLVESAQDYAIFMLDLDGRVLTWNAGAARLKGYLPHEIIGTSFERFYPAEDVARGWPQEELRRAAADGRIEDEGWRLRKDGSRFWASVVITALRDDSGALVGYGKVTRDLTERREHEAALARSEEQLRLMIQAVEDYAIFMLDPGGIVLSWNSGAAAIKGYTASEVLGRNFAMFFTAADVAAEKPQQELALARLAGRAETQGWRVRKDGSLFWASVVITPVYDAHQVLRGFAKVTRDLSEQRRLQELEHSSRRLNEFLALLGHELRNPLAPIRNAVSIMKAHPDMPGPLARMRDIIDRQLGHMTRLVDDLLDVARVSSGKLTLKRDPIDFRDVVQASLESIRPLTAARRQRLTVEMPEQPIEMTGDRVRLTQALQNVLSNAAKYTPDGGAIELGVALQSTACLTIVRDSGIGIDPGALERIFELFVQEESTLQDRGEPGLGIGLSLARTLVEQHGGMLTAQSDGAGMGSTFTMFLPLRSSVALEASLSPSDAPGIAPLRVLVVDDNRDSADTMVHVLQLLGHEARAAYGARQALADVAAFRPRLVLLDLNMPDGNGFAVIAQLREALDPPPYVAAMTGYGQRSDRQSTLDAGFHAHLTKPVGPEDLQRVLGEAAAE